MNSFPNWIRLTAWYCFALAVILSLLGLIAYSATRSSIHWTVNEELVTQMAKGRRPMERTALNGDVQGDLQRRSELADGVLWHVSDQQSNWLYHSARKSMGSWTCEFLRVSGNWSWIDETA